MPSAARPCAAARPRLRPAHALAATAAALALGLAGCVGTAGEDRPEVDAALRLDGPPDAADVGVATAVERGFDGAEGVHLSVRAPRERDARAAARALRRGRADFAVLDARALARTPELVGVMALTTRGGPDAPRPALVLATTREQLAEDPAVARATVRALLRGYERALTDPASALSDLRARFPRVDRARADAALDRLAPAISPPGRQLGALPDGPQYEPGIVLAAAAAVREQ